MNEAYQKWYENYQTAMELFEEDTLYESLSALLHRSKNTFAINRKLMQKAIDVSWVEAIERGLTSVDSYLRHPMRTIEDVEEIVPIALSRKITVESVKHLAQHTDLIQSVDKRTGKITPSKILNVHKEESMATYENKFINTLIDRLYLFVCTRYEKLAQVAKDEKVYTLGYDTTVDDGAGGKMHIEIKIENVSSLDSYSPGGYTVWQRVEKLKKVIEGYKGSELCQALGNTYIRPPVMRTNAIMKNVELKACLALWQYIESYDKAGYSINIEDSALQPQHDFVEDFYRLVLTNLLLFRADMAAEEAGETLTELKTQKSKPLQPKFLRKFDTTLSGDYTVTASGAAGYLAADGEQKITREMPENASLVFEQINEVIRLEKAWQEEQAAKQRAAQLAAEEEAKRKAELERIEAARQAELQRIEEEKAEEARRLEEMLAQKRAEQEAAERERERQEAERLAFLEEKRRREEEQQRLREEQERIDEERRRLAEEKQLVRNELGEAVGIDARDLEEREEEIEVTVTEEDVAEAENAIADTEDEFEDPRAVAERMKIEQQKREKERAERERAERLKADRKRFESKPFRQIYKEYSRNPIYAIPRLIRYLCAILFGWIPEDTDDPDLKTRRAMLEEKRRLALEEKEERERMEVYYRKYAQTFNYRFRRSIEDMKFKRKKAKEQRGKPRPKYTPPQRTPEQEQEIQREMQRLYREYHVSAAEKVRRWFEKFKKQPAEEAQQPNDSAQKPAEDVHEPEAEAQELVNDAQELAENAQEPAADTQEPEAGDGAHE